MRVAGIASLNLHSRLTRLLIELRRRRVLRVLGAYAVVAWVVVQVADIVLPAFLAPAWIMTALLSLSALGSLIAVFLAWRFDLTPRGIVRTDTGLLADMHLDLGARWIDYAIIAALTVILVFVLAERSGQTTDRLDIGHSVAVLPFVDLSPEHDSQYFGDGIAEAVLENLARIPAIRISSRTSSFAYRGTSLDAPSVAKALGVENLLEGSVRKSGDQLRINARLINGSDGTQIWGDSYAGSLQDVFTVQDHISQSIAAVMQVQLESERDAAMLTTASTEAYDQYLRGRNSLRRQSSIEDIDQAIGHFQTALQLDQFALAAAGLCRALWERYEFNRDPDLAVLALQQCQQTEAQYPELAETKIAIGNLLAGSGEPSRAAESFRKVLRQQPHNAEAHGGLGVALFALGQTDAAAAELQQAINLDPAYWYYHYQYGAQHYFRGEYDQAVKALSKSIQLNPQSPRAYSALGGVYFMQGKFLLAAETYRESINRFPNAIAYSNAGTNYFFAGDFSQAEAMFERALAMSPADFRYAGFLAWAIAAQPERQQDAAHYHQLTVNNALARLAINPQDGEAHACLAEQFAALGDNTAARETLAELPQYEPLNINALTMVASAQLLLGQIEQAAASFNRALELGLPLFLLTKDPRLEQFWDDPNFAALIDPVTSNPLTSTQGEE